MAQELGMEEGLAMEEVAAVAGSDCLVLLVSAGIGLSVRAFHGSLAQSHLYQHYPPVL
jgi:hypothetical protein